MAGHRARKTVILSKLESYTGGSLAYGDTATPANTIGTDPVALPIIEPSLDPVVGEYADLNYVRDVMGNSPRIQVNRHAELSFKIPFVGGPSAEKFVPLMRMCGMAVTSAGLAHGRTLRIAHTTTIACELNTRTTPPQGTTIKVGDAFVRGTTTGTVLTVTDDNSVGLSATISGAVGAGISFSRTSATFATNAISVVGSNTLTFANTEKFWEYVPNGTVVTATGIPTATRVVSVTKGASNTTVVLSDAITQQIASTAPITAAYSSSSLNTVSSGHEYGTLRAYMDKIYHTLTGARGTFTVEMSAGQLPIIGFKFLGLYGTPGDDAASNVSYSGFGAPLPVNKDNTAVTYAGIEMNIKQLSIDMANEVKYRNLVNAEDVQIVDRRSSGSISWECDAISAKDWFDFVNAGSTGSFVITHGAGTAVGFQITAEAMAMHDLKYTVEDGIYFFSATLAFVPSSGNDEIIINMGA